jgi:hypothetical protein
VLWARAGAAWLQLPDGVAGLAPTDAPLGPLWTTRAEPWPTLAEGATVVVDDAGLRMSDGTMLLDRRHASSWLGPLPDPPMLAAATARALVSGALGACQASVLLSPPWQATVGAAMTAIGRDAPLDSLRVVALALGGLGPGLTPAGDDALSGVLFASRALGGPTVEPALAAVARAVRTNAVATALLEAATGGFHIEPVHDLVVAAAAGDRTAAEAAAAALNQFGSSSGADVAYGLRLAFTHL